MGVRDAFLGFFGWFRARPPWMRLFTLVNLGGVAFGFWYYLPQFRTTDSWWWPFVPDSPGAVLLAAACTGMLAAGRAPGRWLAALAFVDLAKIGAWTMFVLAFDAESFGTWDPAGLNFWLFFLHGAMVVEGLLLWPWGERLGRGWLAVLAGFLVLDWMDYAFPLVEQGGCPGLRPYTVPCDGIGVIAAAAVALTATSVLAGWVLERYVNVPKE